MAAYYNSKALANDKVKHNQRIVRGFAKADDKNNLH